MQSIHYRPMRYGVGGLTTDPDQVCGQSNARIRGQKFSKDEICTLVVKGCKGGRSCRSRIYFFEAFASCLGNGEWLLQYVKGKRISCLPSWVGSTQKVNSGDYKADEYVLSLVTLDMPEIGQDKQ